MAAIPTLPVSMRSIVLLILTLKFVSCSSDNRPSFIGVYKGGWAESFWTIELKKDSTFLYEVTGHIGDTILEGKLKIKSDTLFLYPDASHHKNGMKFRILNEFCIASLDYHIENDVKWDYDYCKNRGGDWTSKKWNLETLKQISNEP